MSAAVMDERGVIAACPHCGQKNRVPYEHVGETGRCGKCHADLPPPGEPIEVTSESQFDRLTRSSPVPVVVDFWASWCGPCKMVAPELEKVAAANRGRFVIAKLSTEQVPSVAQRFSVYSIPTLAVFVGGREVTRTAGARPAAAIEAFIRQAVGA